MEGLAIAGVRHMIVSSGARCAPLVAAAVDRPGLQVWTEPDERCAGFRALGIGKATGIPAAALCTSGTAGANYFPAVIEARMSGTPLLVLTADRPPHLRDSGAPQTIDQRHMYGRYALDFYELPVTDDDDDMSGWFQTGIDAVACTLGRPRGPVHLNCPFDEPLLPAPDECASILGAKRAQRGPATSMVRGADWDKISDETLQEIASRLQKAQRPVIVCGPQSGSELCDIACQFAGLIGAPIMADIASQLRTCGRDQSGATMLSHYDLYLSSVATDPAYRPDIVLRLGALPTSKTLNQWLSSLTKETVIAVADHETVSDPEGTTAIKLRADLTGFCRQMSRLLTSKEKQRSHWTGLWRSTDMQAIASLSELRRLRAAAEVFEGDVVAAVFDEAPNGSAIVLSNSLPIRLADAHVSPTLRRIRVIVNRGANGIDGMTSTAAGVASAHPGRTILITGDVAVLHDVNGLGAVGRDRLPLTIVVLSNDGGGIFSFLPLVEHEQLFERYIAMPHGCDLSHAAALYAIAYRRPATQEEFRNALNAANSQSGPCVIEVKTDRRSTLQVSRQIRRAVSEALKGLRR